VIGLDTNVLVRYLTQDDAVQSDSATRLIETQCSRQNPGRIALLVLCELVWVLRGAYRYDKSLVIAVVRQLLATVELDVENEGIVHQALAGYQAGSADFADYVIAFSNRSAGCEATYSFDRRLRDVRDVLEP